MKRWIIRAAVVATAVVGTAFAGAVGAHPGHAATPVKSPCANGWYVNDDEAALAPTQKPLGLLFDGPSLVHHMIGPFTLAATPTDGGFTVVGPVVGVKPLFKLETSAPYSTINKTAAGKYWSSKISTGPGSQVEPVDTPAALVGKTTSNGAYSVSTMVQTFGVGYANDTGNKALIGSVHFGQTNYPMTCRPSPTASASATKTTTPIVTASPTATGVPSLPVTGSNIPTIAAGGGALVVLGAAILVVLRTRRRRTEFHA